MISSARSLSRLRQLALSRELDLEFDYRTMSFARLLRSVEGGGKKKRERRMQSANVQRVVARVNMCERVYLSCSLPFLYAVARVNAHKAKRFSNTSVFTAPLLPAEVICASA